MNVLSERDPHRRQSGTRIAWIGDAGGDGGVPKLCALFLQELLGLGVEIDWFTTTTDEFEWACHPNLRRFASPYEWEWNSWYGRNARMAFIASFLKRIRANQELACRVVAEHRRKPYDAVIQFSQGELLALRPFAHELPILLYPQVHAAGELRWCQIEEPLARKCEPWWWRRFRLLYLRYRSRLQRRDYGLARGILGVSQHFNDLIAADYLLPASKFGVVYHPMAAMEEPQKSYREDGEVRLLFVGRISVRKGIEVLIEAIPQLLAEDDRLSVALVGSGALWSNYEPLMEALPTLRCEWRKSAPNREIIEEMGRSDVLLMPSSYEPGGIVVTEALASGMILAASEEVGAAEGLEPPIRWTYPARDVGAFKAAVHAAAQAVRQHRGELRQMARRCASDRFGGRAVAEKLLAEAERLLGRTAGTRATL